MRRVFLSAAGVLLVAYAPARGQVAVGNGGAVTGTSLTVSTLSTGTVLQVSGAVSADGRYVTTYVDAQFSNLDGIDTFSTGPLGAAGGIGTGTVAGIKAVLFRSAQVGKVVLVDHDKPLLLAKVPAMTLKETSLKAAVRKLADATNGNIVLGIHGLEQAGVDVNKQQNFAIEAGTLKDALLNILQVGAPNTDMVLTAEDKVVSIATQAQADNAVITKTYYLQDLLANIPRFVAGSTDLGAIGKKQSRTAVASMTQIPASPASPGSPPAAPMKAPAKSSPATTSIADIITSTVRPEIWKVNGGKIGEIAVVGDHVTIRAPASVHALLEGPRHYNPNQVPVYVGYGR